MTTDRGFSLDEPKVISSTIEPSSLGLGESEIRVAAVICYNIHIERLDVSIARFDGPLSYTLGHLALEEGGSPLHGRWSGTVHVPTQIPDGIYTVEIHVLASQSDEDYRYGRPLGNIRLQRATTIDSYPPNISSCTVQPSIIHRATSDFMASAIAYDNIAVLAVVVSVHAPAVLGGAEMIRKILSLEEGGNPLHGRWSGTVHVPTQIPDGTYHVYFTAFDAAGNMASDINEFHQLHLTIQRGPSNTLGDDKISPSIISSVVEPSTLTLGQSDITFRVIASDNVRVKEVFAEIYYSPLHEIVGKNLRLSYQQNIAKDSVWIGMYRFPQSVSDGKYEITFKAVDEAGNHTSAMPIIVRLQRQPPK
jgi:hypothetical protein